jgi:hypothetical protein
MKRRAPTDHLMQVVDRWMAHQDDDVTLMVARYRTPG